MVPKNPTTEHPSRHGPERPEPQPCPAGGHSGDELLGEIETEIAGPRARDGKARTGQTVVLAREAGNRRDSNAVRVEDAHGKRLGYLPTTLAAWLAPLIDREVVRVEGCLAGTVSARREPIAGFRRLVLTIFLRPAGRRFLRDVLDHFDGDGPHGAVYEAYTIGMDLFDSPPTFAAVWDRLADAYYFDVLRSVEPASPASPEAVRPFLESIVAHARPRAAAFGLGDELEIAGDGVIGAGLIYARRVCHLAVFTQENCVTTPRGVF